MFKNSPRRTVHERNNTPSLQEWQGAAQGKRIIKPLKKKSKEPNTEVPKDQGRIEKREALGERALRHLPRQNTGARAGKKSKKDQKNRPRPFIRKRDLLYSNQAGTEGCGSVYRLGIPVKK
jgi:hypothetical protein